MQNLVFILVFISFILTGNAAVAFGPPNASGKLPLGNCSVKWVVIDDNSNNYSTANLRIVYQGQNIFANGAKWRSGKIKPNRGEYPKLCV